MGMMPAAIATGLRELRCDDVRLPEPEAGKVLVRTDMSSICGSDLHIVYMGWNAHEFPMSPGYPGHEGIGTVVDGGGTEFTEGDLVLTVPNIWESRTFAGHQLVEPHFLLPVPTSVPLGELVMAQQLGTVVYGCKHLPPLQGLTVAVIGQGSVGLFHDFMLKRLGAERVIAIEPLAVRREIGSAMGADDMIDVTGPAATEAVLDLTGGEGADLVIEAVGSVDTLNQSLHMVKRLGKVCVFGLPPTMEPVPFEWDQFFRNRVTMHTVFGAQDEPGLPDFKEAAEMISGGEIDVKPLATHQFPIDQVQEAFDLADSREDGAVKVSLTY